MEPQHPHRNLIRMPVYDKDDRPFMVIWETTNACDLACRHCRAEAIAQAGRCWTRSSSLASRAPSSS